MTFARFRVRDGIVSLLGLRSKKGSPATAAGGSESKGYLPCGAETWPFGFVEAHLTRPCLSHSIQRPSRRCSLHRLQLLGAVSHRFADARAERLAPVGDLRRAILDGALHALQRARPGPN